MSRGQLNFIIIFGICWCCLINGGCDYKAPSLPISPVASNAVAMSDIVCGGPDFCVYTLNPDGSQLHKVIRGYIPQWAPAGDRIALYQSVGTPSSEWLVLLTPASGDLQKLVLSKGEGVTGISTFAWSPNGQYLAYNLTYDLVMNSDLFVVNVNSVVSLQLTHGGFNSGPTWSPDGKAISFERFAPPEDTLGSAWLINSDGSNLHPARFAGVLWCTDLRWSPDGKMVSFHGKNDATQLVTPWIDIYVASYPDGAARRLTTDGISGGAEWSPDGKKLVFKTFHEGAIDLNVINVDGSGRTQITSHGKVFGNMLAHPIWSNDSKRIAYGFGITNQAWALSFIDSDGSNDIATTALVYSGIDWRRK